MLPAGSVCVAVRLLAPSLSAMVGVIVQSPPTATVPVPIVVVPSSSVTTAPASPVPVMSGRPTLVMSSSLVPLSLAGARVRPAGAATVVSRLTTSGPEAAEMLPAGSTWVAVRLLTPSVSAWSV